MSKTQGRCESMFIEANNNTRQKVRELDKGKTGKRSRQQLKEMTMLTGNKHASSGIQTWVSEKRLLEFDTRLKPLGYHGRVEGIIYYVLMFFPVIWSKIWPSGFLFIRPLDSA